jgi:CRISPR/Cas system CSM-associated protein Csm2 small subunit
MEYNVEDIDKILNFKTWSNKKKIDTLLFIDCTLYTNLGKESTQTERQSTKIKSKRLYKAIGKIDASIGKQILNSLD